MEQIQYPNKLKESIILKGPNHPEVFEYYMGSLEGYNVSKDGRGNMVFEPKLQNKDGHKISFIIPAPFLIDSKGRQSNASQVEISLRGNILTLIPNQDWLENHPYPIILDPSFEIRDEILSKRTINTKTYDLGDKKYVAVSYLAPIHFLDENGGWQEIVTEIEVGTEEDGFDFQSISNNYRVYFKSSSLGNYLKFGVRDGWIQYKLVDSEELGAVDEVGAGVEANVINYLDVYSGIDLRYTLSPTELLEEYIIAEPTVAGEVIELSQEFVTQGVVFEEQDEGSIYFKDRDTGDILWTFPKPVMYELGDRSRNNYDLHYEIEKLENNSYLIKKKLDTAGREWLLDFEQVYPVVIDASSGPNSPGTVSTDSGSGGTKDWSNPSYAQSEDGSSATANVGVIFSFCLAGDSLIAAEYGEKPIKDLEEGDYVYSFNIDSNAVELRRINNIVHRPISNYGSKYYNIHFGSQVLKATYNHLVYANNKWIMVRDLRMGDELLDISGNRIRIADIVVEENNTDEVWDFSVEDNHNFFANGILVHNAGVYDHRVRIIKGGSVGSTDRADASAWSSVLEYTTYGGTDDLWGETWTVDDINASNFGMAISAYGSGYTSNYTSYYLQATNLGFNIPIGSTIDGITAEVNKRHSAVPTGPAIPYYANIDHMRITVEYTEGGGGDEGESQNTIKLKSGTIKLKGGTMKIR